MIYIKIGSAYFDKDRIKGYHLRLKKYGKDEFWWEYLHEVIDTVNKAE